MKRARAVETHAADRYLIGTLSDAERDTFEEHFFSCRQCAAEVELGEIFKASFRAVLRAAVAGIQTGPAFRALHHFDALVDGEVCGVFSNPTTCV